MNHMMLTTEDSDRTAVPPVRDVIFEAVSVYKQFGQNSIDR